MIVRVLCLVVLLYSFSPLPALAQITIEIKDYVSLPITGLLDTKGNNDALLARVNGLRQEPSANRLFIPDLNGPLYILDKDTKKLTTYLDFNGREGKSGIFHKLFIEAGYGSGLNTLYFDPDYPRNGKFYTVHIEDPAIPGSNLPDNASFPGFKTAGYTTTPVITTPGSVLYEGVLMEWTDTNISNAASPRTPSIRLATRFFVSTFTQRTPYRTKRPQSITLA